MPNEITVDDAIYFLVFAVAAADKKTGIFLDDDIVTDTEWWYLDKLVERETLSLSNNIEKNTTELTFYGETAETWSGDGGTSQTAISLCIEVLKKQHLSIQYRTLWHMFRIAFIEEEDDDETNLSDTELKLIVDVYNKLDDVTEEDYLFIVETFDNASHEDDFPFDGISDLAELTSITGVELLDEIVALEGVGEKTAMKVLEVFPNSAALAKASLSELQDIDSVSARNALVIKERFK